MVDSRTSTVSEAQKIRVLVADDHDLVRDGIRSRLTLDGDIEICAEASNGSEAIDLAKKHNPDVIMLDISMPGTNGFEAAGKILADNRQSRIIFLSIYDNPEYIQEAIRIGARGYLLKDVSREEMLLALKAINNGGTYLGSQVALSLADATQPCANYNLTSRETEVLKLVANGLSNREIAERLSISIRTVESHRLSLREKPAAAIRPACMRSHRNLASSTDLDGQP